MTIETFLKKAKAYIRSIRGRDCRVVAFEYEGDNIRISYKDFGDVKQSVVSVEFLNKYY